jgi:hypothetical protein
MTLITEQQIVNTTNAFVLFLGTQGNLAHQRAVGEILQDGIVHTIDRVLEHKLCASADVADL